MLVDFMSGIVSEGSLVSSTSCLCFRVLASIAILLVICFRPGTCLAVSNIYQDPAPRKPFPTLAFLKRAMYLKA